MYARTVALVFLLLALSVVGAVAADAPKGPAKAPGGVPVRISLKLTQDDYELGSVVRGELSLVNPSAEWAPIPEAAEAPKFFRLIGEDGKEIEPTKPERFGSARTTQLGPGGFVGVTFDVSVLFPALTKPGRYTLAYRRPGLRDVEAAFRMIPAFDPSLRYKLDLAFPQGDVVVELAAKAAPVAVHNVVNLARVGFFDGASVPRVEPGVMIGVHGPVTPAHRITPFEKTKTPFLAGTVLLEASGSESGDRASYPNLIVLLAPASALEGRYTAVGQVVAGMDVLQKLAEVPNTGKGGNPPFRPVAALTLTRATVLEAPVK